MNKIIITALIGLLLVASGIWWLMKAPSPEEAVQSEEIDPEIINVLNRAAEINSLSYSIVINDPAGEITLSAWHRGDQFRLEAALPDDDPIFLVDFNQKTVYSYWPKQGQTTQGTLSQVPEIMEYVLKERAKSILNYRPAIVDRDSINDQDYLVLEHVLHGDIVVKNWIWSEYGLPVRTVTQFASNTIEVRAENIEINPELPDDLFAVPEFGEIDKLENY